MIYYIFLFRIKAEKGAKKDGEIFDAKKEEYKPSEQRKTDQGAVDTQVNTKDIFQKKSVQSLLK